MAVRVAIKEECVEPEIQQKSIISNIDTYKIFSYDNARYAYKGSYPHILRAYFAKKKIISKEKKSVKFHIVQKGETIQSIANQYGTNLSTLKEMNVWLGNKEPLAGFLMFVPNSQTEQYIYYDQIQTAFIGEKVYVVVETEGFLNHEISVEIWNRWHKIPEVNDKRTKLTLESNMVDRTIFNATVGSEISTSYKNAYTLIDKAIFEINLFPIENAEKKELLEMIYQTTIQKGLLYIKVKSIKDAYYGFRDFLLKKEDLFLNRDNEYFMLEKRGWCDPVSNPQRTYYNSKGVQKEQNGAFGSVRLNNDGSRKNHQGLDLFATISTPCTACLNGEIVRYSNEGDSGYGNVLILKVRGDDLRKSTNGYTLEFDDETISGDGFDINAKVFYLRYAHLSSAVKTAGIVLSGDLICNTGDTGNATGVPNPHLHFEIAMNASGNGSGLSNRYNPAFFVRLRDIDVESQTATRDERS